MSSQWKYFLYILFILCKNKCDSYKIIVVSIFWLKKILPAVLESSIKIWPLIDLRAAVAQWVRSVLQIGRSLVRSQMVLLDFSIDIIPSIALWRWGRLSF
jgi:hypothetical protein